MATSEGIASDLGNIAAEATLTHAIPWLSKKAIEMGRYYGSEALRNPKLQQKMINYGMSKLNPLVNEIGSETLNRLSTKIRPKKKYKTNRNDLQSLGQKCCNTDGNFSLLPFQC